MNCLIQLPPCNCGSAKAIFDFTSSTRLMQFLMGLNDTYDGLRNQILVLDPLPTVYKAYSMAVTEVFAMMARFSNQNSNVKKP